MALTSTELLTACAGDPDRWALATGPDPEAIALCRACPLRWQCARDARDVPGLRGIWAGVFVAESGRPRTFALRQLQSLADHAARHRLQ